MDAPEETYRREFCELVLALRPSSILEIGCGQGQFLRSLGNWKGRLAAIDPDAEKIAELRRQGLDVRVGSAEQLDFPDNSFDIAVFSFSAHHIGDWHAALKEALRVARAVAVLDPWRGETLSSQRVGAEYDRWSKTIDRMCGEVNNDWFDVERLVRPLLGKNLSIGLSHRLILADMNLAEVAADGEKQLAKVPNETRLRSALDSILARARRHGISHEGATMAVFAK